MDEFASRHYPVQENMRFQKRSWIVERLGWLVLLAIAVVGLSGVFVSEELRSAMCSQHHSLDGILGKRRQGTRAHF